jgi:hypothetical protein
MVVMSEDCQAEPSWQYQGEQLLRYAYLFGTQVQTAAKHGHSEDLLSLQCCLCISRTHYTHGIHCVSTAQEKKTDH